MPAAFGRYELFRRLAAGGMGEVYLARHRGPDGFEKLLVLKTLLPHLCRDEEFIAMFKDEARICAQLVHPNICQVFEFDQCEGVYYMAMEYLRGEDLRRLWKACDERGMPLRPPLACRIVADAAAGLHFAHSLRDANGVPYRIVHRDVSPQNIFVTFEGGVKLIDFGVAKAAGRLQHTRTGALKGKYGYMSPEQVMGAELDGRSDVFALGIVLHELLTGRRLFKAGSEVETLERVRACEVPLPSAVNPQAPRGLDGIVLKALSRDRDRRYATAQEFRLALEEWLIEGRMSASSAHLAAFLEDVYGEPPVHEPQEPAPDSVRTLVGGVPATVNQRTPLPSTVADARRTASASKTRSGAAWIGSGAAAAAAVLAATLVLFANKPPPSPVVQITAVHTAAPVVHAVTIHTEPEDSEIYEGPLLLGRSPKVWIDAPAGAHELTLRHDGYRDETGRLVVARDGEEFTFRLRPVDPARAKPELPIKAER